MLPTLLSINNYYYLRGGAETVFLEENNMFESIGWKVVPFSMSHCENIETPWKEYFVNTIEFEEKYSVFKKIQMAPKVVFSFEARRKLSRLLESVYPDFCHVHNLYHHISPSVLSVLKHHEIPTILTLHDLKIACPAYKMLTHDGVCERCKSGKLYNVLRHKCIKQSVPISAVVMIESYLNQQS